MLRIAATLLLLLATALARAGVPELPRFRVLGVAEGLPSSTVNALATDRAGYVWIATGDGLARHDGVGFRVWRHVPGDPRALPGNNVQALHVDAQDRVWVGTEFGGISVLDADRSGFTHYRASSHPGIGSDDTWTFASRGRELWFGTADGGLHRLDARGRITRWTREAGLPSDTVLALAFDADGALWIGTDSGLARWDGARLQSVPLPGAENALVYSLTRDGDALMAGTAAGAFRHERTSGWTAPAWSPMFERPNAMLAYARDADGDSWIASQRGVWHARGGGVPMPVRLGDRPAGKPVVALLSWRQALWTSAPGAGLAYLRSDWRRMAQLSRRDGSLGADQYRAVAPARDGGLWLAGTEGVVEHLAGDGAVARLPQSGRGLLEHTKFASVAEDRDGRLWLGHRGGLLRVHEGGVDAWQSGHGLHPLPDGYVDLLRLAPDGTLWLSAQGGGIQQRDVRTGAVIAQALVGEDPALAKGDTEAMAFDAGGRLWIAGGMGLARWDAPHGRFVVVPAMRGARVHAFDFDGPDDLWLQRLTGLEHYRRAGDGWTRVARVEAGGKLPAVEGAALRVDARRRVWLSTRRGLFRWDPRTRRMQRFGVAHGLSSQEFQDRALALAHGGALAATTHDGAIVLLDTQAPDPIPMPAALRIDGFDVRRQGRWQPWPARAAIALRPADHEWRVRLRLLAHDAPAATQYWTRLEGFDRDWVAQDGGERVFTGLPAGTYLLRARAVDAAGNPAREQRLRLRVLPPWWRGGWMVAALLIACALLLWRATRAWEAGRAHAGAIERIARDRELARAASDAKSEFLATFGHEVRTPMTGVLGMAELLLATPLGPRERGYAESIQGAGQHLLRLVDDALDLARIEAGRLELVDADFDLHALLEEVRALFAPIARGKGVDFRCVVAASVPRHVRGDGHRVRQVLLNLCGNAVKFTARGSIALRTHALGAGVRLEVQDTGPGMDAEAQSRLFRRFEQAEGARTAARHGGSGLGLAICRELATAMGGSIGVESRPGVGSVFRVDLPLAPAAAPACASADVDAGEGAPSPSGHRILLVEDDAVVARVVQAQLEARGHAVIHAAHALDALSALRAQDFAIALLDLDLPGMDGVELARLLRANGHDLPLLALTARSDPAAEPLALAAGMDGFLRKPVGGGRLARAVAGLLEAKTVAGCSDG